MMPRYRWKSVISAGRLSGKSSGSHVILRSSDSSRSRVMPTREQTHHLETKSWPAAVTRAWGPGLRRHQSQGCEAQARQCHLSYRTRSGYSYRTCAWGT